MGNVYNRIKSDLEKKLFFLSDKPEETLDSSLRALWFKAAGYPKSAEVALYLPLPKLSKLQVGILNMAIEQRLNGKPLAYITGRKNFMGLELITDSRAFIPRKETEILGRKALEFAKRIALIKTNLRIFDICCGCGNLGLTMAHFIPNAIVYTSDLSSQAIELAQENIDFLKLQYQVTTYQGNLFSAFESDEYYREIDLIVCNPPYISSTKVAKMNIEIIDNEPHMAFDGGMAGLKVIQALIREAHKFLSPGGCLIFEVGVGQGPFIIQLCEQTSKYKNIEVVLDDYKNIRVIALYNF